MTVIHCIFFVNIRLGTFCINVNFTSKESTFILGSYTNSFLDTSIVRTFFRPGTSYAESKIGVYYSMCSGVKAFKL